jgi:3-isopropylmalate dehydratase small subunit
MSCEGGPRAKVKGRILQPGEAIEKKKVKGRRRAMVFRGRVWKFGDDLDTDAIIPVQFTVGADPAEFARHCMEGIDPDFSRKVHPGDIIVAGRNFGCGSSREPAPLAIKAAGISCVIAKSFARIFYRNAFNVGLPLLESSSAPDNIAEGDELEIDVDKGVIADLSGSTSFNSKPIPPFMQELIRDGGLMNHIAKRFNLRPRSRGEEF